MSNHGKSRPCTRCGIMRKPSRAESVICADCRYVLSKEELKAWMKTPIAA